MRSTLTEPLEAASLVERGALCKGCHDLFAREDICDILKSPLGLKLERKCTSRIESLKSGRKTYRKCLTIPAENVNKDCLLCYWLIVTGSAEGTHNHEYYDRSPYLHSWPWFHIRKRGIHLYRAAMLFIWPRLEIYLCGNVSSDAPIRVVRYNGPWTFNDIYLGLCSRRDDPAASDIAVRALNPDFKCDETYEMIRQWSDECDKNHGEGCQHNMPRTRKPPSHLIDVSPCGKNEGTVVLKKTAATMDPLKYAAFSYVWGVTQMTTTTTKNYLSHCQSIEIASLGQAIEDAIWVTRKLSLQYLWVDSLCIIQDLDTMKMLEIGKMDSIYAFACITIVAGNIASSQQSFLSVRPHQPPSKLNISGLPFGSKGGHAQLMIRRDPIFRTSDEYPEHVIDTRGWTFQEQFMSPRILVFTKFELLWICSKTMGRSGLWFSNMSYPNYSQFSRRTIRAPSHQLWRDICEEYSGRKLSDPRDKLPALSSIASYFDLMTEDRYLAGIWLSQLNKQLNWRARSPNKSGGPRIWRAPSWSWVSIDGPVEFYSKHYRLKGTETSLSMFSVIGYQVQLLSEDVPFGQVISGNLTICGRLICCQPKDGLRDAFVSLSGQKNIGCSFHTPEQAEVNFDTDRSRDEISNIQETETRNDSVFCLFLNVLPNTTAQPRAGAEGLIETKIEGLGEHQVEELCGLALKKTLNGSFHRIGHFYAKSNYGMKAYNYSNPAWRWLEAFHAGKDEIITIV